MARVACVVTNTKDPCGDNWKTELSSDDLPTNEVAACVMQAVRQAWRAGCDPVHDMQVSVHFLK